MASTDTTPMVVKKCASPLPIPSAKIGVGIMDLSGLYEGTSFSLVEPVLSSLPNNYKPLFLTVSIKITGGAQTSIPPSGNKASLHLPTRMGTVEAMYTFTPT